MNFSLIGPEIYIYGRMAFTIVYAGINLIKEVNNK
tara:strand:+ start:1078 stop:1182 length:105 start_codon:yes stop_codon:yes gene_type:complete